ncbi:hypothetical protein JCM3770_003490 [Rhodotorula araucariae]
MLGTGKKDRRQPTRAAQPSAVIADSEYVARRVNRHLADLERTNYTEPTTGPSAYLDDDANAPSQLAKDDNDSGRKKKKSMAVRSLLMYRKNLATLLSESDLAARPESSADATYLTAAAPPSARPPLQLCSVCGYRPRYTCLRCGLKYCDVGCRTTHDESRCERR